MKKLLVIGAGYSQNVLIKKAKSMGYYTLTVDGVEDAIGYTNADEYGVVNMYDKEACLKYAIEHKIDGVITADTDLGALTTAYVAEKMGLPGLKYASALRVKNKHLIRKCLYENHLDDLEQSYEINKDTDINDLANKLHYPVIVKPCDGTGSKGVSRVDFKNQLPKACQYAMDSSITHRGEIESFIVGKEYSAESLVVNGEVHVLAIMKKWMTNPPYYAELSNAIPCGLPKEIEEKVISYVKKVIKTLDLNFGPINMDMIITKDGQIYIVDIGPRIGGNMIASHVIPYGTGIDYIGAIIQNAVGDPVDLSILPHISVVTKILAFKGGIIKRLPNFKELEKDYNVEIFQHMKVGDKVNEYHINADSCGCIIATAKTVEVAKETVEKVLKIIEDYIFD